MRLDAFVRAAFPALSRREAEKAIDEKFFLIDGKAAKKGDRLAAGALVSFVGPAHRLGQEPLPNHELHVPIVHEDSHLVIVDKPAGMDTHGFSARDDRTLANFLAARYPEILGVGANRWQPGLVHRLDRETSGLLLIAKTEDAFAALRQQFRRRQVKKTYRALVRGVTAAEGSVSYPLAHDPRDRTRMRALVRGMRGATLRSWQALTRFRKLDQLGGMSFLEIEMATGVTHQIRVHLASIGHPIVGDALYGAKSDNPFGLRRHFLHACRLEFKHPAAGRTVSAESGLPDELREVLRRLKTEL